MTNQRLAPCSPGWQIGLSHFRRFIDDDEGAVTVDWVVLTAAVIGLGFAVIRPIVAGATDISGSVGAQLGAAGVTLNGITLED